MAILFNLRLLLRFVVLILLSFVLLPCTTKRVISIETNSVRQNLRSHSQVSGGAINNEPTNYSPSPERRPDGGQSRTSDAAGAAGAPSAGTPATAEHASTSSHTYANLKFHSGSGAGSGAPDQNNDSNNTSANRSDVYLSNGERQKEKNTTTKATTSRFSLILFALLVLINLIVIFGNILVIVAVYATEKLRNITNIFIVSLATADLMLGLFVLPYALLFEVLDTWIFGQIWCRGWLVTDVWISTASILNLCAISIDRYVAVTRPVKYRSIMTAKKAKCIVSLVWLVSFLICFPPLLPKWTPSSPLESTGGDGVKSSSAKGNNNGDGSAAAVAQAMQRSELLQQAVSLSAAAAAPKSYLLVNLSDDDEDAGRQVAADDELQQQHRKRERRKRQVAPTRPPVRASAEARDGKSGGGGGSSDEAQSWPKWRQAQTKPAGDNHWRTNGSLPPRPLPPPLTTTTDERLPEDVAATQEQSVAADTSTGKLSTTGKLPLDRIPHAAPLLCHCHYLAPPRTMATGSISLPDGAEEFDCDRSECSPECVLPVRSYLCACFGRSIKQTDGQTVEQADRALTTADTVRPTRLGPVRSLPARSVGSCTIVRWQQRNGTARTTDDGTISTAPRAAIGERRDNNGAGGTAAPNRTERATDEGAPRSLIVAPDSGADAFYTIAPAEVGAVSVGIHSHRCCLRIGTADKTRRETMASGRRQRRREQSAARRGPFDLARAASGATHLRRRRSISLAAGRLASGAATNGSACCRCLAGAVVVCGDDIVIVAASAPDSMNVSRSADRDDAKTGASSLQSAQVAERGAEGSPPPADVGLDRHGQDRNGDSRAGEVAQRRQIGPSGNQANEIQSAGERGPTRADVERRRCPTCKKEIELSTGEPLDRACGSDQCTEWVCANAPRAGSHIVQLVRCRRALNFTIATAGSTTTTTASESLSKRGAAAGLRARSSELVRRATDSGRHEDDQQSPRPGDGQVFARLPSKAAHKWADLKLGLKIKRGSLVCGRPGNCWRRCRRRGQSLGRSPAPPRQSSAGAAPSGRLWLCSSLTQTDTHRAAEQPQLKSRPKPKLKPGQKWRHTQTSDGITAVRSAVNGRRGNSNEPKGCAGSGCARHEHNDTDIGIDYANAFLRSARRAPCMNSCTKGSASYASRAQCMNCTTDGAAEDGCGGQTDANGSGALNDSARGLTYASLRTRRPARASRRGAQLGGTGKPEAGRSALLSVLSQRSSNAGAGEMGPKRMALAAHTNRSEVRSVSIFEHANGGTGLHRYAARDGDRAAPAAAAAAAAAAPARPKREAVADRGGPVGAATHAETPTQPASGGRTGCTLFHDKTYVVYSSLGSFYIPMLIMIFFYSRIYLVASRAQKAMQRGYMTTKLPPISRGASARGAAAGAAATSAQVHQVQVSTAASQSTGAGVGGSSGYCSAAGADPSSGANAAPDQWAATGTAADDINCPLIGATDHYRSGPDNQRPRAAGDVHAGASPVAIGVDAAADEAPNWTGLPPAADAAGQHVMLRIHRRTTPAAGSGRVHNIKSTSLSFRRANYQRAIAAEELSNDGGDRYDGEASALMRLSRIEQRRRLQQQLSNQSMRKQQMQQQRQTFNRCPALPASYAPASGPSASANGGALGPPAEAEPVKGAHGGDDQCAPTPQPSAGGLSGDAPGAGGDTRSGERDESSGRDEPLERLEIERAPVAASPEAAAEQPQPQQQPGASAAAADAPEDRHREHHHGRHRRCQHCHHHHSHHHHHAHNHHHSHHQSGHQIPSHQHRHHRKRRHHHRECCDSKQRAAERCNGGQAATGAGRAGASIEKVAAKMSDVANDTCPLAASVQITVSEYDDASSAADSIRCIPSAVERRSTVHHVAEGDVGTGPASVYEGCATALRSAAADATDGQQRRSQSVDVQMPVAEAPRPVSITGGQLWSERRAKDVMVFIENSMTARSALAADRDRKQRHSTASIGSATLNQITSEEEEDEDDGGARCNMDGNMTVSTNRAETPSSIGRTSEPPPPLMDAAQPPSRQAAAAGAAGSPFRGDSLVSSSLAASGLASASSAAPIEADRDATEHDHTRGDHSITANGAAAARSKAATCGVIKAASSDDGQRRPVHLDQRQQVLLTLGARSIDELRPTTAAASAASATTTTGTTSTGAVTNTAAQVRKQSLMSAITSRGGQTLRRLSTAAMHPMDTLLQRTGSSRGGSKRESGSSSCAASCSTFTGTGDLQHAGSTSSYCGGATCTGGHWTTSELDDADLSSSEFLNDLSCSGGQQAKGQVRDESNPSQRLLGDDCHRKRRGLWCKHNKCNHSKDSNSIGQQRSSSRQASLAPSGGSNGGRKKTFDDFLMAVAGIDSSSDEEDDDDEEEDDDADEQDLSSSLSGSGDDRHVRGSPAVRRKGDATVRSGAVNYSLIAAGESILIPSINIMSIGPSESVSSMDRLAQTEKDRSSGDLQQQRSGSADLSIERSADRVSDQSASTVIAAETWSAKIAPSDGCNEQPHQMDRKTEAATEGSERGDKSGVQAADDVKTATLPSSPSGLHRQGGYYERATSRESSMPDPNHAQSKTKNAAPSNWFVGLNQPATLIDGFRNKLSNNQPTTKLFRPDTHKELPDGMALPGTGVRRRPKRTSRWHAKRLKAETKAAKTVGIIVGGFIFCWLPFFTVYLVRALLCESPQCIPQTLLSLFIWLGYLNSAINPVIYGLFSADFRQAFKNIVCRCRFRRHPSDDAKVVSVLVDNIIKSIL